MNSRNRLSESKSKSHLDNRFGASSGTPQVGLASYPYPFIYALFFVYLSIEFIRPQVFLPALGVIRPALLVGVCLLIFSVSKFQHAVYKEPTIRLLIVFAGLGALAVLYAVNKYWALQYTQVLVLYIFAVIVPMYVLITSLDRLRVLILFWIFVHLYLAIYCLTHGGTGPGSFLEDENDMALTLNVAIPFAYFLWASKSVKGVTRWVVGGSVALMVASVVATASRGGFVGLVITAAAIIWFSKKRVRNAIMVVLCACIFYISIPAEYKGEIQSISDTEDGTRVERFYSWERGWEMFIDNPVLGVGVGNFPWRFSEYELKSKEFDGSGRLHGGRAAHSLYFTLIPETGLIGVVIFSILIYQFFHRLRGETLDSNFSRSATDYQFFDAVRRALLTSMVAFLVTAIFISVLYYPQLWYLIGFSLIYEQLYRRSREHTKLRKPDTLLSTRVSSDNAVSIDKK